MKWNDVGMPEPPPNRVEHEWSLFKRIKPCIAHPDYGCLVPRGEPCERRKQCDNFHNGGKIKKEQSNVTVLLEPGLPRESLILRQIEIVRVWNEVIEKAAGIADAECTTFDCRGCTACDIADEIRSHKRSV